MAFLHIFQRLVCTSAACSKSILIIKQSKNYIPLQSLQRQRTKDSLQLCLGKGFSINKQEDIYKFL